MDPVKILAFAGSLRAGSFNRKLILNSQRLAPESMEMEIFALDDIPLYHGDREEPEMPAPVVDFKRRIEAADGLLIATPEYNFSFPGVLKNAIDWASRPDGGRILAGKPVALQSASPGWAGGLRAQLHLRQVLHFFPMRVQFFPEVCVGQAHHKFDGDTLTDPLAIENITKQLTVFVDFVRQGR
ncbi:MAG TPA: NAD(P)H-dependent oxidoreductase [Fimbriimonadaceae bacterium]|nr:NAD(P)H-dependent oxidoreductase [Fimbriimonadaceae bacterium]